MSRLSLAAAGLVTVALLSCGGAERREPLSTSLQVYNEGLRWQRFEDAAARIDPAERDDFLDRRDRLADELKITGYEIIRARLDDRELEAKVHVKYSWYLDSHGVLHESHVVQEWERRGPLWILVREKHLRGEPMPGMLAAEPVKDEAAANGAS